MRRNPLFIFRNRKSEGIYDIPLKSTIHIIDSDGNNTPKFIELIGKTDLRPTTTIGELLDDTPDNYIDLMQVGEVYSELELISEDGHIGWRILGRDPNNYGTIGNEAIDLSLSDKVSLHNGAMGENSIALNKNTGAWGENTLAAGFETIAGFENQTVIGQWNKNAPENIFEIGIGADDAHRRNAFQVSRTGVILAPELDPAEIVDNRSLITKEYFDTHAGENSGELKKITESGKTGYRIAARTHCNYGNFEDIGHDAVDLSCSTLSGDSNGASGNHSFAAGFNVIMRNESGAVLGRFNDAKNDTIFEVGNGTGVAPDTHSNAFEVYLDGRIVAPGLEKSKIDTDRSLVTKEFLSEIKIKHDLFDVDVIDSTRRVYGFTIENYDTDTIEVFNNGILLRPGKNYDIFETNVGIQVSFVSKNYTLHVGDWLRVKVPTIIY